MPLRTAIRILLSLAIVMTASLGSAHGAMHTDRQTVATAIQASGTSRLTEGGCTSSGQTHCQPLAVTLDRSTWTQGEVESVAHPSAVDDPHRSGFDPRLEERPPRSL